MGLDISAVSELKRVELPEGMEPWSDEYYDWENELGYQLWTFRPNTWFEKQSTGLEDGAYDATGEGYSFRAGSYSGYGMWWCLFNRGLVGIC